MVFAIAATCGAVAVLASNSRRPDVGIEVAIATTNVARGAVLTKEMVRIESWPERVVVPGLAASHEQVVDRCVLHPIEAGEPILEQKLAPTQAGAGLPSMIPRGMRAFTIKTTDTAGVAGFVLPGSQVDVLLNMADRSSSKSRHGGGITITLLQNVEVLAVAQQLEAPSEHRVDLKELKSVTLLVTPQQAAKLNVAISKGTLHLSLRNPQDSTELDPPQATMAELISLNAPTPALAITPPAVPHAALDSPTPAPPLTQIWTLRGTQRGRVRVLQPAPTTTRTKVSSGWPWNLIAAEKQNHTSDEIEP